jgi:ADP-ribose pyrophosphatase YjhB (NUDIX family)
MLDNVPTAKIGVKAIIIKHRQLLVVVKQYAEGIAYILPGGSQNHGEPLDVAIRRECQEELGTDVVVDRLLFVREYIGKNHEHTATDADLHIVDIMFACHVPDDYVPHKGTAPDFDQVGVAWLPIESLDQLRFFPAALKQALLSSHDAVYLGDVN